MIDECLASGISDLSLRPLAAAVGTSARLLIYHFRSKEELLTLALEGVRHRINASVRELSAKEHPGSLAEFLPLFWNWAAQPSNRRYFRLIFEIGGLAMHNRDRFPDALWNGAGVIAWVNLFQTEFAELSETSRGASARSTFILATLNGLLRDLVATGDVKRTTEAMELLTAAVSSDALSVTQKKRRRNG